MKSKKYLTKAEPSNDSRQCERAISRKEARDVYRDMYDEERRQEELNYMRTKLMRGSFYKGMDPLRAKELAFGGMVREDDAAMSNLPRQAIHCEYPENGTFSNPFLSSTEYVGE